MDATACILCGGLPPLTGEHLWPDWYNRRQPEEYRYELESVIQDDEPQYVPKDALDLKPAVLCPWCNNQWGSDLEQQVARILAPMTQGEARRLDRRQQELISAWFYLKAMVSERLVPPDRRQRRFFRDEEGQHLRTTKTPPAGTAIWIGQYRGSRSDAGWVMDRGTARMVSDDPAAGVFWHSVTYSIGQVLLQLFATTAPIPFPDVTDPESYGPIPVSFPVAPGDWGSSLTRIWEPSRAMSTWPPVNSFDDDGFIRLAERWLLDDERERSIARPKPR